LPWERKRACDRTNEFGVTWSIASRDTGAIVHRRPFAKATCVKAQDCWKIFWMRASLKWQGYEPTPAVSSIDEILDVVDRDQYVCLWG